MLHVSLGRLALGLAVGLALTALPLAERPAEAQAANTTQEPAKFDTVDSVELHGTFYPGGRGTKSPCAMLIHSIGENSQKEGWDELAKELQKTGISVLTFDLRGHGDSTSVGPSFWSNSVNQTLKSFRSSKTKDKITSKDFTSLAHYKMMVNDVAAAKRYLDRRNDASECNSANTILIGAESGATLAAMWLSWAMRTPKQMVGLIGAVPTRQTEGQDVACAVWLSISPKLNTYAVSNLYTYLGGTKDKVPMYFLYGENDTHASRLAKQLSDSLTRGSGDKRYKETTGHRAVKDTKLAGRELLGKKQLGTEELITKYVDKVLKDRGSNVWAKREVERTPPVPIPIQNIP
jgi:alpha-beta hydrolase superfamily lysophospholipase